MSRLQADIHIRVPADVFEALVLIAPELTISDKVRVVLEDYVKTCAKTEKLKRLVSAMQARIKYDRTFRESKEHQFRMLLPVITMQRIAQAFKQSEALHTDIPFLCVRRIVQDSMGLYKAMPASEQALIKPEMQQIMRLSNDKKVLEFAMARGHYRLMDNTKEADQE